jgi:hypothetical protein
MRFLPLLLILVLSTGSSISAQALPPFKAIRDLRVGDVDDPDYALTWMVGIALSAEGSIYSLHYPEKLVRIINTSGQLMGKFGRAGNGPGEFNNPAYIGWRGDSLWIYDSVQRRFNLYDGSGRSVSAVTVLPAGTMRTYPRALLSDGSVLAQLPFGTAEEERQGKVERSALVRLSPEGGVRDTLVVYQSGGTNVRINDPHGKWGIVFSNPFGTSTLYAVSPDGSSVYLVDRAPANSARQASYTVRTLAGRGGATVRNYNYTPVRVTRVQVDSGFAPTLKFLSEPSGNRPARLSVSDARRALEQAVPVPEYHPPVQEVVAGRDGTLWLRRENLVRATNRWDIIDAGGQMIGWVELPRALRVLAATRSIVVGEEQDELQVPYIVRYRITR